MWPALLRGGMGLGESYVEGWWDTPDLSAVIELAARNMDGVDEVRRRLSPVREPYQRGRQLLSRTTPDRARADIHAHYDMGNELFAAMLDPTMTYSCAVFERRDQTLQEAQEAKLERICRKLDIGAGDRVLEIGTGWGSFALHAAPDPRLPRHHDDALRRAARARGPPRRRRRALRPRQRAARRLPRTARARSTSWSRSR